MSAVEQKKFLIYSYCKLISILTCNNILYNSNTYIMCHSLVLLRFTTAHEFLRYSNVRFVLSFTEMVSCCKIIERLSECLENDSYLLRSYVSILSELLMLKN